MFIHFFSRYFESYNHIYVGIIWYVHDLFIFLPIIIVLLLQQGQTSSSAYSIQKYK